MKQKGALFLIAFLAFFNLTAQQNEKAAYEKALEAIALMNEGKYEESIQLLKESEKLDPGNYNYPYEIALAYTYQGKKPAYSTLTTITSFRCQIRMSLRPGGPKTKRPTSVSRNGTPPKKMSCR